jgi:hypothetical protein
MSLRRHCESKLRRIDRELSHPKGRGMGSGNKRPGERPLLGQRTEVRRYRSLYERDQGIVGMRQQGWVVWQQAESISGWRVTFEPAPPPDPAGRK